jgi:enoyl-CoA hydratase/carnithine racemase
LATLERTSHRLALKLGRLPRERVALAKLAVWDGLNMPLAEGLELERRLAARLKQISSAAARNGPRRR